MSTGLPDSPGHFLRTLHDVGSRIQQIAVIGDVCQIADLFRDGIGGFLRYELPRDPAATCPTLPGKIGKDLIPLGEWNICDGTDRKITGETLAWTDCSASLVRQKGATSVERVSHRQPSVVTDTVLLQYVGGQCRRGKVNRGRQLMQRTGGFLQSVAGNQLIGCINTSVSIEIKRIVNGSRSQPGVRMVARTDLVAQIDPQILRGIAGFANEVAEVKPIERSESGRFVREDDHFQPLIANHNVFPNNGHSIRTRDTGARSNRNTGWRRSHVPGLRLIVIAHTELKIGGRWHASRVGTGRP